MSVISPSITAYTLAEYEQQLAAVRSVVDRIHIDLADGELAKRTVAVDGIAWPEGVLADIHLMYQEPLSVIDEIVALHPNLVIVHSEADGVLQAIETLQLRGIKAGIALIQSTSVESVASLVAKVDHVLIFSGTLGHFGGVADLGLLHKANEIRLLEPDVEIGWDGGANADNVARLSHGGVDVIVAGGAIQNAEDPARAYGELYARLQP